MAFERICQSGLSFYRNQDWPDIRHGVFTRQGGVSESHFRSLNLGASIGDDLVAVKENHARIYRAADVNGARAVSCWLVHGTDTLVVNESHKVNGQPWKADAIITDLPDTPLVMRFADCVPLLLYDPVKRVIGLGHAGWRGTVKGVAANLVRMLRETYGCQPQDLEAVIGPAISPRNYQVGEEVAAQADAYFGSDAGVLYRDSADNRPHFDLWSGNRRDLERQGLRNVKTLEICTYENTEEFYSHRAENGATGRFGVVISL